MSDNPINELNDLYQAMKVRKPQYVEKIIDEEFEGNSKFNIEVSFCDMTAMGIGLDKKEAKCEAARKMLDLIDQKGSLEKEKKRKKKNKRSENPPNDSESNQSSESLKGYDKRITKMQNPDETDFPSLQILQLPDFITDIGENISPPTLGFPKIEADQKEKDLMSKCKSYWKKPKSEYRGADVEKLLHDYLIHVDYHDYAENEFVAILRLCAMSGDFSKMNKSLHSASNRILNILKSFQSFKVGKKNIQCSEVIQDHAFFLFTRKTRITEAVLKLVVSNFNLSQKKSKYIQGILQLCQEGLFRNACLMAMILGISDKFHIKHFCIPMVLTNNSKQNLNLQTLLSRDGYLLNSKKAAEEMVSFLDKLSHNHRPQLVQIYDFYPNIKEEDRNYKLNYQIEKTIKTLANKWKLSTDLYPFSIKRKTLEPMYHWTKECLKGAIPLVNYRELLEDIVGEDLNLKEHADRMLKECEKKTLENESNPSKNETYFELPIAKENIYFVNSRELFTEFMNKLESSDDKFVGLDTESHVSNNKVCLLQISLSTEIFLLDWDLLLNILDKSDFDRFNAALFQKKIVVGFAVVDDVRNLAKSSPKMEESKKMKKNVIDLLNVKTEVLKLLDIDSNHKGLSGFCKSVLGLPLCKDEQIGNWSRRPLRQSQIVYAALDAWICPHILSTLQTKAEEQDKTDKFNLLIYGAKRREN